MATLCGSAFGYGNFPGVESSMALDRLELRFATSVEQAVNSKLTEALERKVQVGLGQGRDVPTRPMSGAVIGQYRYQRETLCRYQRETLCRYLSISVRKEQYWYWYRYTVKSTVRYEGCPACLPLLPPPTQSGLAHREYRIRPPPTQCGLPLPPAPLSDSPA